MPDCKHEWTSELFPGPETRWCHRCNDTETEVELANLRAEVERLREVTRQIRVEVEAALEVTHSMWVTAKVAVALREIHKLTIGLVKP